MENLEILFKKKAYEVLCNFVLFGYPSYPIEIFPFAHLSFCEQIITYQSCVVDDWDSLNDSTTLKYFKKLDDLVDQTREYALEMLMCAQERELRRTVKSYLKPDITFDLSSLDYEDENAVFTLKKGDQEAYLIIRIAPNVHVTDKEGL